MPGPVVHHLIAERAFDSLRNRHGMNRNDPAVASALYLGSQGPDFMFFNTNDWPGTPYFNDVAEWFRILDAFTEIKNTLLLPLKTIDEAMERGSATYGQLKATTQDLTAVMNVLQTSVTTALEGLIVRPLAYRVFEQLGHPSQGPVGIVDYRSPRKWWVFDVLHYRRTGEYAAQLRRHAKTDVQRAYALGYVSHFAADTVIHPFINLISGGPYRTHGQRHKVVETHQDALAYNRLVGGDVGTSRLFTKYLVSGTSEPMAIGDFQLNRRELHPDISALIVSAFTETYQRPDRASYGQVLEEGHVRDAFSLWLHWFEGATTFLDGVSPPPPYSLSDEVARIWKAAQERSRPTVPFSFTGGGPGSGGILGILEALAMALLLAVALVVELLKAATVLADAAVATAIAVGDAPIRALLRSIHASIYSEIFLSAHRMLVLQGLAYPTIDDLDFPQTRHMSAPRLLDAQGKSALHMEKRFPFKSFLPEGLESEAHLVYPFSLDPTSDFFVGNERRIEAPASFMGPPAYLTLTSPQLIAGLGATDPQSYADLAADNEITLSPKELGRQRMMLGDAVSFTQFAWERVEAGEPLCDFDLDSDRGFGHQTWGIEGGKDGVQPQVIDEVHTDGSISPRKIVHV